MSLIDVIRECVETNINKNQLCNVAFGTVTSDEPLEIQLDDKYILTKDYLILCRNVTEHEIYMTVEHETENHTHTHDIKVIDAYTCSGEGIIEEETHLHEYKGKQMFLVHKGLKVDERVVLIKMSGGQKFLVVDRLEEKEE